MGWQTFLFFHDGSLKVFSFCDLASTSHLQLPPILAPLRSRIIENDPAAHSNSFQASCFQHSILNSNNPSSMFPCFNSFQLISNCPILKTSKKNSHLQQNKIQQTRPEAVMKVANHLDKDGSPAHAEQFSSRAKTICYLQKMEESNWGSARVLYSFVRQWFLHHLPRPFQGHAHTSSKIIPNVSNQCKPFQSFQVCVAREPSVVTCTAPDAPEVQWLGLGQRRRRVKLTLRCLSGRTHVGCVTTSKHSSKAPAKPMTSYLLVCLFYFRWKYISGLFTSWLGIPVISSWQQCPASQMNLLANMSPNISPQRNMERPLGL